MVDVTGPGTIRSDFEEEADRIIGWAARRGAVLRALGGIAVQHHCPSSDKPDFKREPKDLDFIGLGSQSRVLNQAFEELGYAPDKRFNALHGNRRLLFLDPDSGRDTDVFLDKFEMSHSLPLKERLTLEDWSIPVTDLLMTKLQVAEINLKDITDAACVIVDHPLALGFEPEHINACRVASLCASDWGLYTTTKDNLERIDARLPEFVTMDRDRRRISERIEDLRSVLVEEPKTLGWKLRNIIGKRIRWYETPEETRGEGPIKLE